MSSRFMVHAELKKLQTKESKKTTDFVRTSAKDRPNQLTFSFDLSNLSWLNLISFSLPRTLGKVKEK